ncbi:probable ATP-dependent RNA helicase DDX43 [Argiope bruennichi]|uniref:RNA helicase n=1 Tax=Argiope bruennichi TaxID=94029 RepID=A0A8T0FH14_ARGBR|nr:probable ATP-dependent RNA helicase DDX43 [Argiope bruennichi]KAF8790266.1 putative ATP-dependent RNA helicase DDX43 like protein [Argiope bruennichi]
MEEYWDDGEEFLSPQPGISRNEQPNTRLNDAPPGRNYNSNSYNKEYSANGASNNFREGRPRNSDKDFSYRGRTFSRGGHNVRNWRANEESSRGGRNERKWRSKEESSEIQIHSKYTGRVIGRGGSKIQKLQNESGARIKILQNSDVDGSTSIRLTGSSEARQMAKTLIEELTVDFGNMSTNKNLCKFDNSGNTSSFTNKVKENEINSIIDWDELNKNYEEQRKKQLAALPKLKNNFYKEDPVVAAMTKHEIYQFRCEKNRMIVMNVDINDKKPIPNPITTFVQAFQHYPELLEKLKKQGFSKPSPIQSQAWPIIMSGYDLVGISQTGTGKTIAFLLPALIHIAGQTTFQEERVGPSCVILAPTQELAQQIEVEAKKYSYCNITSVCIYGGGGGSRRDQVNVVTKDVDIVIATPRQLNDLVNNKIIDVFGVTYVVLDEADHMLNMGFEYEIFKIFLGIRPDRQIIMTSTTWNKEIEKLAARYMTKPIEVNVGCSDLAAVHSVTQHVIFAEDEDRRAILEHFLASMKDDEKVIVFVNQKAVADDLSSDLILRGVKVQSIHGDREQVDREQALNDIKTGYVKILIATDVASRGFDIKGITHVFNMYFPQKIEDYVHRVGRTGRAGQTGTAISIFTQQDWMHAENFIKILKEANQSVPQKLYGMADHYKAWKRKKKAEIAEACKFRCGTFDLFPCLMLLSFL